MKILLCVTILFVGANCQSSLTTRQDTIVRPCATYDLNCIRHFLAAHSHCHIKYGPVPNPQYFAHTTVFVPVANITLSNDDLYRSYDARVEEFYVNRDTDRLLLAVELRNLTFFTNSSYLTYHRRGREPIVNRANLSVLVPSVTATMIFPDVDDLQVQLAEVTMFFNTPLNLFELSPSAFAGADPGIQQVPVQLALYSQEAIREGFMTDAYQDMLGYVQTNLCDFGIKLD